MFEAEVSRTEALQALEFYKHSSANSSLSSLHQVCVAMERGGHSSVVFLGRRSRTKSDLSMKMYQEEIQEWYEEYSRGNLIPLGSPESDFDCSVTSQHSIN